MKHSYKIGNMTCSSCQNKVQKALESLDSISSVIIDFDSKRATIEMSQHVSVETMQEALSKIGKYTIEMANDSSEKRDPIHDHHHPKVTLGTHTAGKYHCPMHCEGEKVYDQPGDCPVCGMNLEKIPELSKAVQYTCPMHPEVIKNEPGDCPICGMNLIPVEHNEEEENILYHTLLKKFKVAVIFTIPIFIIAMSEMVPDNPLYQLMDAVKWNWTQLILSIPVVFYATWMFFEKAWKSMVTKNLNMFTLIGIGAGIAWVFSVVALLFPDVFPEQFKTHQGTVFVYFEATTVILTLVLLGQLLEAKAHSQTSGAIKELLRLVPSRAFLVKEGTEIEISIDQIQRNDILRVKPGDKIPVDGVIYEGDSIIDESMITGEPIPVEKGEGEKVSSGTINGSKSFLMKAEKIGEETLLSQIIEMVNQASRSQAPIQKLADRISTYFVPIVLLIAVLTFIIWGIWGPEPSYVFAFVNAIAVLIIACPCALGLATPMSVMVGVGRGAQSGVLIKNAESLEKMNKVDVVIVDKTGTITEGKPSVEKVVTVSSEYSESALIQVISSLNQYSEHPLAEAIVKFGKKRAVTIESVSDFEAVAGKGVKGIWNDQLIMIGNKKMLDQFSVSVSKELMNTIEKEQALGKTVSYIAINTEAVGYVVISDAIKATSKEAIQTLQDKGIEVVMLTGDNKNTAQAVVNELNLTRFKADCLPEDKLKEVKQLQSEGKVVAMAGDGINDAPALAQADVGIAMGTGTDVAIESAEITLVKGDLQGIVKAYNLSHSVMRNIKQNLFFAFIYNVMGVPIAAGLLYPFFGLLLSPMLAALAMSFSSVSVIINALRLRRIKL